MPVVLQICNVGKIMGGTGACAWSIMQALPDCEHQVIFLSNISADTRQAFSAAKLMQAKQLEPGMIRSSACDVVIMHNVSLQKICQSEAWSKLEVPVVQYAHSECQHYRGDINVCCSAWLKQKLEEAGGSFEVLYQPVPQPELNLLGDLALPMDDDHALIIGRICTPSRKKWPGDMVADYTRWSMKFPLLSWEFVGCPREMQQDLSQACRGKAQFFPASFAARGHLCRWDALLYHQPGCEESFGRVVAEAMRAGCIPIVDRLGGFCEQVQPETGFLCTNETDFDVAIQQIHDVQRRRELSLRAKVAGERFSYAAFRQRFFNLFA